MPPILVPYSAKHIAIQILVHEQENGIVLAMRDCVYDMIFLAVNYLFKVRNWSTRIRCEKLSGLRMKTLKRCQWRRSGDFIVNCERISHFVLIAVFE